MKMQADKHVILCIDDDPDILEYLRVVLEANGYIVVGAESAEAGLRAYKKMTPDLIITDLMMEEIDSGTGLVKELQLLGNEAPVYMLSSAGDNLSMTADHASLGLTGIFQKPIDTDMLLALLRTKLA
jgi:DNA-binding response OmpR family regulator